MFKPHLWDAGRALLPWAAAVPGAAALSWLQFTLARTCSFLGAICGVQTQNPGGVCVTLKAQLLSKGSTSGSSADSQIPQGLAQEGGKGGSWLSSAHEQNFFYH